MINPTESYVMIDQINSTSKFKSIETSNDLSKEEQNVREHNELNASVDDVNISDASKQMEALKAFIENSPIDNTDKLNAIKEALNGDQYKVNSDNIAEKLIADSVSA